MKPSLTTLLTTALLAGSSALIQAQDAKPDEQQTPPTLAPESPKFEGENKKLGSYLMGYQAGYDLARLLAQQGIQGLKMEDLDEKEMMKGFKESLNGSEPSIEMEKTMGAVEAMQAMLAKRNAELANANKKVGDAYRAERAKEDGMVTTESGLMYKVKTKGEGDTYQAPPEGKVDMQTQFQVRYAGRLIDGTEFDSSGDEPVTFNFGVIPGFGEALRMMPEGSTWEIILKPELAYGDRGSGSLIQPGSTLVFDLTLEKIMKPAPPKPAAEAVTPPVPVPPAPTDETEKTNK